MKRYMLFGGSEYYPLGGFNDFLGAFNSKEDALSEAIRQDCDWYHVIDSVEMKCVSGDIYHGELKNN